MKTENCDHHMLFVYMEGEQVAKIVVPDSYKQAGKLRESFSARMSRGFANPLKAFFDKDLLTQAMHGNTVSRSDGLSYSYVRP